LIVFAFLCSAITTRAQEAATSPGVDSEKTPQEKADQEKKAFTLLEQIVNEAQLLRLPENRVNVQIDTADLLWENNQGRARTLFTNAGESIAEMMRNIDPSEERRGPNSSRTVSQLRQKLVLTAARHEATLAYQLLSNTRPAISPSSDSRISRGEADDNLEQTLLARIAALDPKLAYQNAADLLDKGQFPRSLTGVLSQLQQKDKEAAAKLEDKMIKKLLSANLLSASDSGDLALRLLRPGVRAVADSSTAISTNTDGAAQYLAQTTYVELLGNVVDAALKVEPQPGTQRGQGNFRGRRNLGSAAAGQTPAQTQSQLEQTNARNLMSGMRNLLPQIEQYLPLKATAVRDKLTALGMVESRRAVANQMQSVMREGTTDELLALARNSPQQVQSRIYQRAASKALSDGQPDQARQIASDYLEGRARERILGQIQFSQLAEKADATKLDELRSTLYGLRTDEERVDLLVQLSFSTREKDPQLAIQLLDQARQYTNKRASNYGQLEQQLKVAEAFRELAPARSFEVLEPGILQLNELLSAAATLSGFEVNVFRDGEMPLETRNGLSGMVNRFGQAIGKLATSDWERAQALADRFQHTEPRIVTRMNVVRSLLGKLPATSEVRNVGGGVRAN
jgi:hypothetical protein